MIDKISNWIKEHEGVSDINTQLEADLLIAQMKLEV